MSKRTPLTSDDEDIFGPVPVKRKAGGLKPKQVGQVAASTRYAKELFLKGNGDGKPIRNLEKLADKSGAALRTIMQHIPDWERESREIAVAHCGTKRELVESVTGAVVQWQSEGVAQLKAQCDGLKVLLKSLLIGTDAHANALKLFTATFKAWTEQSGFADYADTQAAYAKELAKTAARQHGKSDSGNERNVTPGFEFSTKALPEKVLPESR